MKQSESIANLAAALVKVQPLLKHPKKSAKNARFGPFADLNSVIDANREVLHTHGLAVVQVPTSSTGESGNKVGVCTVLVHESGEWMGDTCELPLLNENKANCMAQIAGGNITYLRRYGWQAILGINGETDDDGEAMAPGGKASSNSSGGGGQW